GRASHRLGRSIAERAVAARAGAVELGRGGLDVLGVLGLGGLGQLQRRVVHVLVPLLPLRRVLVARLLVYRAFVDGDRGDGSGNLRHGDQVLLLRLGFLWGQGFFRQGDDLGLDAVGGAAGAGLLGA